MVVEVYYNILSAVFSPVLGMHPAVGELLIAAFITFIITLFYKFLVNQKKVKEIRDKVKEIQKQSKDAQKDNPEKSKELTADMLKLTNQQMKMTLKPMMVTLLFVILTFPWLKTVFIGPIVYLPFSIMGREWFGWFLWYVILSMPLSVVFRKAMDVM